MKCYSLLCFNKQKNNNLKRNKMKDLKQNLKENLDMDTKPYPKYYTKYNCVVKCSSYNDIMTVDVSEDSVDVNISNLSESFFIKEAYKLTNEEHFIAEIRKAFNEFDKLINN